MDQLIEVGLVVTGLTQVLKPLLPEKYYAATAPLMAVVLGGLVNVYLLGYSPEVILEGLAYGLAATGLYKTVKS